MTKVYDIENPEWTKEDFRKARPVSEVLPHLVHQRGKQKQLTKVPISIRLSPEVVAYFKSYGKGWQTRLNNVLQEYVATHQG